MTRYTFRSIVLAACVGYVLALPVAAAAQVKLVHVTTPVSAGDDASLTIAVSPAASCSIAVEYKTGQSKASGLGRKRSVKGRITWTWAVGSNTSAGRWPIVLSCGKSGTLHTAFRVR